VNAVRVLWLGELTPGRENNVQLLRLAAAAAVLLFHCYALTDRWTSEPLWRLAPELNFGALGVKMFFVISGFLVTQSWLARRRLDQFVVARMLRIYPALLAATLWTIALAAASSQLPWPAFLSRPQTGDYLWRTAFGYEVRDRLPGAFAHNPFPDAVNGSLWTLPVELRLYLALAVAGVAGLLARRVAWLVAGAAICVAVSLWPNLLSAVFAGPPGRVVAELTVLFALGSVAYAWRDALPVSIAAALVAIALIAWNPSGLPRGPLFAPLLAYVLLVVAYHPRLVWPGYNRVGDYSYGLYVYAFPLQQTIVQRMPGIEPLALFAWAFPAVLAVAALSWHALEQPALGLKSRFDRFT
jgi:peptidoglycan/LPS O-acetylase OafA/YrhL